MRWKDKYSNYERPKRPKARKCSKEEIGQLLVQFLAAIKKSPVLDALGCTVTAQRGRFYVCQVDPRGSVQWGRITPLDERDRKSVV